ncbi:MAG: hypothetical protein PHX01_05505 [Clostridia bacterium]|nr:hypothetical protein [Clostridia bacterium]
MSDNIHVIMNMRMRDEEIEGEGWKSTENLPMSYPGDRRSIEKNVRKRETKAEAAKVQKTNASVKPKETVSEQASGVEVESTVTANAPVADNTSPSNRRSIQSYLHEAQRERWNLIKEKKRAKVREQIQAKVETKATVTADAPVADNASQSKSIQSYLHEAQRERGNLIKENKRAKVREQIETGRDRC